MAAIPGPLKRANETALTYRLKWAGWEWLYREAQCRCVGTEVRLEGPGGRVVDLGRSRAGKHHIHHRSEVQPLGLFPGRPHR